MTAKRPDGPSPVRTLARLATGNVGAVQLLQEVTERYTPVAYVRLGLEPIYVITDAELVRQLFVDNSAKVSKAPALKESNALLGNGLLTSEGDFWKRQRKLVQPGFHNHRIQSYVEVMNDAVERRTGGWRSGDRVDLTTEMSSITLDIVVRSLFGSALGDRTETAAVALNDVMDASSRWLLPGGRLLARVPTAGNRRARRSSRFLSDLVRELIDEHRRSGDTGDILSMLLEARDDDGAPMDDQQVQDEVMTMLLAGHETTAMALSWALLLLHHAPEARALLYSELQRAQPQQTFEAVAKLPYTRAVIAESLRLFPPAWIMGRKAVADLQFDQVTIPTGSTIVLSPLAIQRSERYWTDGEAFRPERWLDGDGRFDDTHPGQPAGAWLPFGMGQRKCVGQVFAWTEAVVVLAQITRRFEVEVHESLDVDVTPAITLRPKQGLQATIRTR